VLEDDNKYKNAKIVVIAKDLCGAGTDLALKSLASIRQKVDACLIATCCHGICDWQHYVGRDALREIMEGKESDDKSSGIPSFGPLEFDILRRWSAATVATPRDARCTPDESNNNEDRMGHKMAYFENGRNKYFGKNTPSISEVVRGLNLSCGIQGLGRACQRLIDYGRSRYIRNQIFKQEDKKTFVNLSHYVEPQVTPQNACLMGMRSHQEEELKSESPEKV